jgi:epoxyqueuosine reductase
MDSSGRDAVPSTEWLRSDIERFVAEWGRRRGKDFWRRPLVGVASALDPLFGRLERVADPGHAMPADLLRGVRSVIVFFVPFQPALGEANDRHGRLASRGWAESYVETNLLIRKIGGHLGRSLRRAGHSVLATPATHNFDENRLVSGWSHKHVAYIAGLGTFGHHHLLITEAGCCGRLGSLLTSAEIRATPRPEEEWCLGRAGRPCLACVSKCSYGALLRGSFDRHACYRQCLENDAHYSDLPLVDVCGKCSCEVPCSYEIPS